MIYLNRIIDFLDNENIEYLKDASMKKYTSFKIGGNAELLCIVKSKEELSALLSLLSKENIKPFILGNGSNLLVSDNGIKGVVIKLEGDFLNISVEEDRIVAGVML